MLQVTPAALTHLRHLLTSSRASPEAVIRLARTPQQRVDMIVGPPMEDDQLIEDEHGPVLAIEAHLARALDGLIFDYLPESRREDTEAGFVMRPATDTRPAWAARGVLRNGGPILVSSRRRSATARTTGLGGTSARRGAACGGPRWGLYWWHDRS